MRKSFSKRSQEKIYESFKLNTNGVEWCWKITVECGGEKSIKLVLKEKHQNKYLAKD